MLPEKGFHVTERRPQTGFYKMINFYINQLINQTTTNELQCYLRKVSKLFTSMKWATYFYITNLETKWTSVLPEKDLLVQEHRWQIGFYEMRHFYINQLINQTTTNELQCYLRKIFVLQNACHRLASIKWATSTSTNLSTRQLQMNFSATWERSPWSGAQVASWLYEMSQPTCQPNNY